MTIQIDREAAAQAARPLWGFAKVFGRHGAAVGVLLGLTLALTVLTAVGLTLLYVAAVLFSGDMGGPLLIPAMLVTLALGFLLALLAVFLLILPSVLLAEFLSAYVLPAWRYPVQMVLSALLMLPGVLLLSVLFPIGGDAGNLFEMALPALRQGVILWTILLLPLGLYWWVAKAVEAGMTLGKIVTLNGLKLAGAILRHGPRPLALDAAR